MSGLASTQSVRAGRLHSTYPVARFEIGSSTRSRSEHHILTKEPLRLEQQIRTYFDMLSRWFPDPELSRRILVDVVNSTSPCRRLSKV